MAAAPQIEPLIQLREKFFDLSADVKGSCLLLSFAQLGSCCAAANLADSNADDDDGSVFLEDG